MSHEGYTKRFGIREYHIPPEERELVEKWKQEIQEILDVISVVPVDRERVTELAQRKGEKRPLSIIPFLEKLEQEHLSQESLTVGAISLWVLREKAGWSVLSSTLKPLLGGTHPLSKIFEKGNTSNCIDTSELARQMAEEFGVKGEIVDIGMSNKLETIGDPNGHKFFMSEGGAISDVWYGRKFGGFFENFAELIEQGEPIDCSQFPLGQKVMDKILKRK